MRDRVGGIWRGLHAARFEPQFEHGAKCIQTDSLGYVIKKQNSKMASQWNCRPRSQFLDYLQKQQMRLARENVRWFRPAESLSTAPFYS